MALTHRYVVERFGPVAELFAARATDDYEAQLAVYVRGELVVDLAAGIAPDALMTVYSSSKGLAAIALALLVERGDLDLDERVAAYWPQFAAADKAAVTVRQLLSHQAGLPAIDGRMPVDAWFDDHAAADLLAQQLPFWRPGAAFGYHGVSIGPLMSELCHRITGQSLQRFYEEQVRRPSGAEAYLGLPAELESRVVELLPMADPTPEETALFAAEIAAPRGPFGPHVLGPLGDILDSPRARAFGNPAGGGVACARGLATAYLWATGYGAASGGVGADTLARFAQTQVAGYDLVLDHPYRSHGVLFQKPTPAMPFGSHRAFGHDGAGGSMAFADPVGEICLGYTMRRTPFPGGIDRGILAVIAAVRTLAT
jgi:CubicO group peptidase (beta-lactamase class C family)